MTLPWSAQQIEWLQAMGLDVLAMRGAGAASPEGAAAARGDTAPDAGRPRSVPATADAGVRIPPALQRAARGVDLTGLLAGGPPHDPATRRAFWRALRPLRKAAGRR